MPRLLLAAVLLAIPVNAGAQITHTILDPTLVVRYYKFSPSADEFSTARDVAGGILGTAGIGIVWLDCRPGGRDLTPISDKCQQPLRPNEMILRVVPGADANATEYEHSLGYSLIPHAGAATVATVYSDRVAALARAAHSRGVDLLGRAIAHEIGHLLMGTNEHAAHGLMRAFWSHVELRRNLPADWAFSDYQAQMMRSTITSRSMDGI